MFRGSDLKRSTPPDSLAVCMIAGAMSQAISIVLASLSNGRLCSHPTVPATVPFATKMGQVLKRGITKEERARSSTGLGLGEALKCH